MVERDKDSLLVRRLQQQDIYMEKMKQILITLRGGVASCGPAQLMDHLYLGNMNDAYNIPLLKRLGITHVLNCAGQVDYSQELTDNPYPKASGVQAYREFDALDNESYPMMRHYSRARHFINKAKAAGGRVLVHCEMGVNRSATLAVAYIMEHENISLLEAVRRVKLERPVVLLNEGFRRQLFTFAWENGLLNKK